MSKALSFHEGIDNGGTSGIVVQVFKVHFEEVDLLFHFLENDLIVPVSFGFFEDSHEEEFVEAPYLVDVHEDGMGFFLGDDLFVEERCLKVRNYYAEISDIIFLGFQQLSYDHLPLEKIFDYPSHSRTGEHTPDETLYLGCCLVLENGWVCLHMINIIILTVIIITTPKISNQNENEVYLGILRDVFG